VQALQVIGVDMTDLTKLITIRELRKSDLHFILDSSVKCLSKYSESLFKGWDVKDTCQYVETAVLSILSNKQYSTFIAVKAENDEEIIAYITGDVNSNHILLQFTKYLFRDLGIQKNYLLPLVTDETQPISVNWQTKEMLNLKKANRIRIMNLFTLQLIQKEL
jgi:hypothetical protein